MTVSSASLLMLAFVANDGVGGRELWMVPQQDVIARIVINRVYLPALTKSYSGAW